MTEVRKQGPAEARRLLASVLAVAERKAAATERGAQAAWGG